ncbi:MAG: hypothetical protein M1836_006580 [Candelina mexicana]|nr:MAG: hypothetical protein M1836_006580 [Candelina mexicana]
MKRPPSESLSPYTKRGRKDSSPTRGESSKRAHISNAELSIGNGSTLVDDSRLASLESELANYASSIKSAQARHLEERQTREARLHALFVENTKASELDDQELRSLQHLYATANRRLVDHLKKVASSLKDSHAVTGLPPVNGRHGKQDDTVERQHDGAASIRERSGASHLGAEEPSRGASFSDSSRTTDHNQSFEQHNHMNQANQFLNSNFVNLAEALARVHTPAEVSRNSPQAQTDVKPARSAKALWEATYKPNARPATPTTNNHTRLPSGEHGRLTPIDQGTKMEAEDGELYERPYNTLQDASSAPNMPDPHDHIPRLCPIALSGRERCPHGNICRLWKKCIGTCKFMAQRGYCNHGDDCKFGHDHIEQRRAAMERQQEHYETAK